MLKSNWFIIYVSWIVERPTNYEEEEEKSGGFPGQSGNDYLTAISPQYGDPHWGWVRQDFIQFYYHPPYSVKISSRGWELIAPLARSAK